MVRNRSIFSFLTLLSTLTLPGCTDDSVSTSTDSSSSGTTQDTNPVTTSTTATTVTTVEPTGGTGTGATSTGTTDTSTSTSGPTTDPVTSTDPGTSTSTTTSTTTGDSTTGAPDSSTGDASTTGDSTTGGPMCTPGQVNCDCDGDNCEGSAICALGKCLPAGDGSCFSEFDFVCDEPDFCPPGSDPFDCCAAPQNGVCEEFDFGGACAPYSDYFDCGYCPFVADGVCDAPGVCPDGTDEVDCCASPQDGLCEEMSQGGQCPDGSDPYDCGVCIYENDGACDVPDFCPDGTDAADCCATQQNGLCEEMSQGGLCPDGSDPYDCGFCPYEDDGACDVPDF